MEPKVQDDMTALLRDLDALAAEVRATAQRHQQGLHAGEKVGPVLCPYCWGDAGE